VDVHVSEGQAGKPFNPGFQGMRQAGVIVLLRRENRDSLKGMAKASCMVKLCLRDSRGWLRSTSRDRRLCTPRPQGALGAMHRR
jgi:hypothetical protein